MDSMIADDRDTPFETAVKMITAPAWIPIYFAWVGCRKAAEAWSRRKPKLVEPEVLTPVQPAWQPTREFERAVFAALILAGEPINNRRLAELMDCSPGEASRRVAQLEGVIRKARKGREVLISLH
jgi:hypothetical protein